MDGKHRNGNDERDNIEPNNTTNRMETRKKAQNMYILDIDVESLCRGAGAGARATAHTHTQLGVRWTYQSR